MQEHEFLINHKEIDIKNAVTRDAYKIIRPESIPFISYPYEWSFSQLKDAALLILQIQSEALKHGMTLKNASAFNIQFLRGKPAFTNTLSFQTYKEGDPWIAYNQFCRHFLAPLALMKYKDAVMNQLFRIYLDGIPLDFTSHLLPIYAYFNPGVLKNIIIHHKHHSRSSPDYFPLINTSKTDINKLIDNLSNTIENLQWKPNSLYCENSFKHRSTTDTASDSKIEIVNKILKTVKPRMVWDISAKDGTFSKIASNNDSYVLSMDTDPSAVEMIYLNCKQTTETRILPLLIDLMNPSPCLGWNNQEHKSLIQRGTTDLLIAFNVIHYLSVINYLPFNKVADFFSKVCKSLLIEFIPESDSQIQHLLQSKFDTASDYNTEIFIQCFSIFFEIQSKFVLPDSERVLYLMRNKSEITG